MRLCVPSGLGGGVSFVLHLLEVLWIISLGGKHFCPLSHLEEPPFYVFIHSHEAENTLGIAESLETLKSAPPSLFPPPSSHLYLKAILPHPSQIVTPTRDQVFKHINLRACSHSSHNRWLSIFFFPFFETTFCES